jgi:gliding motility-associated-like protein
MHPTGGGGISPFSPPTGGVNDSTYYYVTQTVNGCESDRSRLLVTVTYKPNGIISPTRLALCQDELDTFFYYGNARPDAVYNWVSPHPNTTEISGAGTQGPYVVRFDSSGTYNVSVQVNNRGCLSDIAYQPVTVRVRPAIHFVAKEDACVDEVINVALSYISPNIDSFRYQFADGIIHYGAASGGPYGVSFATAGLKVISNTAYTKGCPSRVMKDTINVHPYPDARFTVTANSGGSTFCNGDSLVLTARTTDSNDHFVWTPDNFFASGNLYTAKGFLTKSGYVKLQLTSRYGCMSSDSLYVQTESCCRVFFPNAFSPNNDLKNDRFRPVTRGHHEVKTFRIINRWGQVVYESKDEVQGWDGTYNGKAQDVGTYYYYLSYSCGEGASNINGTKLEEKGEFLLIR